MSQNGMEMMNVKNQQGKVQENDKESINKWAWDIMDAYFRQPRVFVQHHLQSFNYFVAKQIEQIVQEYSESPKSILYADYNKNLGKYEYEYHIKLKNVQISNPVIQEVNSATRVLFPNEARVRDFVYLAQLKVDIYHYLIQNSREGPDRKDFPPLLGHPFTKLPILVQSEFCNLAKIPESIRHELGECPYDQGGYFIINGNERTLIMQERKAENIVHVFKQGKGNHRYSHKAEIKSVSEDMPFLEKPCEVKLTAKDTGSGRTILVKIKEIRTDLPVMIVFRACGFLTDKEIADVILYDVHPDQMESFHEIMRPSFMEAVNITDSKHAYEYISRFASGTRFQHDPSIRWMLIQDILRNEFLPHMGTSLRAKGMFLGYMVRRLLQGALFDIYDERDSFIHKRISSAGHLMAQLFRGNFSKLMREVESYARTDLNKHNFTDLAEGLNKKFKTTVISAGLKSALRTGNWGVKNVSAPGAPIPTGVSQVVKRLSHMSFMSHLRQVKAPLEKTNKSVDPRMLNGTHWGMMDPADTPEGASIGLVKHLSMFATITVPSPSEVVIEHLYEIGMLELEDIAATDLRKYIKVFLNGAWIGVHPDPAEFVNQCREWRRTGVFHLHTGIHWDIRKQLVYIFTDAGRMVRPLMIVEDNKTCMTLEVAEALRSGAIQWLNLFTTNNPSGKAIVEYIDSMESDGIMIAMSPRDLEENKKTNPTYMKYTHMEIHPTTMFASSTATLPFAEHNQSPRVVYGCAQSKQAVGLFATNYQRRMDNESHVLYYPERPIVQTKLTTYLRYNDMPYGMNAVVAICTYSGYNQEDSIILNQTSLDRGLFVSAKFQTYTAKEQKNQAALEDEKFCKPQKYHPDTGGLLKTLDIRSDVAFDKLQDNGFVKPGTYVKEGDALIGKVIPVKTSGEYEVKFRDASTYVKKNEEGMVDWVFVGLDDQGYKFGKVRIRSERVPQIGDKFTSRSAQKGTCGITYKQEDMPFNHMGISPDMIVNPHAYPKRMTIGQLIECIMGKTATSLGTAMDGTPFQKISLEAIGDILQNKFGWDRYGNEVLYNGRTGQQMDCTVFMGPTYYLRLKHMVADKIHSRSTGPNVSLTRQPSEGRARDGGFRIGEMERDVMLAHGTLQFLKERMFDTSDKFFVYLCKQSGYIAAVNPEKGVYKSLYQPSNTTDFIKVQIPYASKLFIQELLSMGLSARLDTEELA